jgi:predicted nucleotidyltransferase
LLGHPDEQLYLREIARRTAISPGALQRELALLTRAGLIVRTTRGNLVYFQANRASSIFGELQGILYKTFGLVDLLRDALVEIEGIVMAFVFGSAARTSLARDSDIDLMVIGDVAFADVVAALSSAQRQVGRDINPTVYTFLEVRRKLGEGNHFLQSVAAEPRLDVIGVSDDLERLATQRLADHARDQRERDPRPARRRRKRPQG